MVCKGNMSLNFISVLECTPAPVPYLLLVSGTLREQPSTFLDAGKSERNVIIWVGSKSACARVCARNMGTEGEPEEWQNIITLQQTGRLNQLSDADWH